MLIYDGSYSYCYPLSVALRAARRPVRYLVAGELPFHVGGVGRGTGHSGLLDGKAGPVRNPLAAGLDLVHGVALDAGETALGLAIQVRDERDVRERVVFPRAVAAPRRKAQFVVLTPRQTANEARLQGMIG
jgi:hypothetical protein